MSERQRPRKQKARESGSATRPKAQTPRSTRADLPRRAPWAGLADLPRRIWQAGNAAISQLLGRQSSSGQPLAVQTQAEMEQAFRSDFSDVRVHHDAAAQTAAESLSATAFTHGDDIYLGAASPAPDSPAGRALIAHELAHVVQQRHATEREPEVSQPGDRFEQAADHAAQQAVQGQSVESAISGAPPAV